MSALPTIKKRADFLAVRGGQRCSTPGFLLEMRKRAAAVSPAPPRAALAVPVGPRFGFTVTKKLGNAVTRNRIRRRLKAAFTASLPICPEAACDYVIVARSTALDRPFDQLLADVERALKSVNRTDLPSEGARRHKPAKKEAP